MTKDDLDKLRKYVSITLSHSHPEHLDIYLHDILDFCSLNLLEEEINEEKLDELAEAYFLNTYNNGVKDPNLEIINEKEFAVADFKAGCRTILKTIKL